MTKKITMKQLLVAGLVAGMAPLAQAGTVDFDPTGEFAAQFDGAAYSESATGGLDGTVGVTLANLGVTTFDGTQSESMKIAADGDAITVGTFINFSSFGTLDGGQTLRLGVTKGGVDNFAFLPFSTLTVDDASEGTFRFEERNGIATSASTFSLSTGTWYYFETTLTFDAGADDANYDILIANASASGVIGSTIESVSFDVTEANDEFTTGATLFGAFKGTDAFDNGAAAVIDNFYVSNTGASQIPEPGSLALLGLGGLCMLKRRLRG